MRNKVVIERKLERVQAELKQVDYSFKRNEPQAGFNYLKHINEMLEDIQTLLNNETQD